jgi:hypothetical protein
MGRSEGGTTESVAIARSNSQPVAAISAPQGLQANVCFWVDAVDKSVVIPANCDSVRPPSEGEDSVMMDRQRRDQGKLPRVSPQ